MRKSRLFQNANLEIQTAVLPLFLKIKMKQKILRNPSLKVKWLGKESFSILNLFAPLFVFF